MFYFMSIRLCSRRKVVLIHTISCHHVPSAEPGGACVCMVFVDGAIQRSRECWAVALQGFDFDAVGGGGEGFGRHGFLLEVFSVCECDELGGE